MMKRVIQRKLFHPLKYSKNGAKLKEKFFSNNRKKKIEEKPGNSPGKGIKVIIR